MQSLVLAKAYAAIDAHRPPPSLISTLQWLSSTPESYNRHRDAIAIIADAASMHSVAKAVRHGGLTSEATDVSLRDEALHAALDMVQAALAADGVASWASDACALHLKIVDLEPEVEPMSAGGWLSRDALVEAGGEDLAHAVSIYTAIRHLVPDTRPWSGCADWAQDADDDITQSALMLPPTKRARTTLTVTSRDNDTIGRLCFRYPCTSANELRALNPKLLADGFGKRAETRLRKGTQVIVYDNDNTDEHHNEDNGNDNKV